MSASAVAGHLGVNSLDNVYNARWVTWSIKMVVVSFHAKKVRFLYKDMCEMTFSEFIMAVALELAINCYDCIVQLHDATNKTVFNADSFNTLRLDPNTWNQSRLSTTATAVKKLPPFDLEYVFGNFNERCKIAGNTFKYPHIKKALVDGVFENCLKYQLVHKTNDHRDTSHFSFIIDINLPCDKKAELYSKCVQYFATLRNEHIYDIVLVDFNVFNMLCATTQKSPLCTTTPKIARYCSKHDSYSVTDATFVNRPV